MNFLNGVTNILDDNSFPEFSNVSSSALKPVSNSWILAYNCTMRSFCFFAMFCDSMFLCSSKIICSPCLRINKYISSIFCIAILKSGLSYKFSIISAETWIETLKKKQMHVEINISHAIALPTMTK